MNTNKKHLVFILGIIVFVSVGGFFLAVSIWKTHIHTQTENAYDHWKQHYVVRVTDNMSRVINPQDNNITVSEGMGYGLLFSVAAGDRATFESQWKYVQHYLDENGLMNWKIDSSGQVIGEGSAADADQDIAYALLLASKKWPQSNYLDEARKMIRAIAKYEVASTYLLLPGDKWGERPPVNPSYIAPAYYSEFAAASGEQNWGKISSVNMQLLYRVANEETGLLPDWVNQDGTTINNKNNFEYDAIRVPIRLLQYYKRSKDTLAGNILQKEYDTFSKIGPDNLSAGYTLTGRPLEPYLNVSYLSSFTAASWMHPYSMFSIRLTNRLINTLPDDYYSSSLKVWTLFIITGKL